MNKVEIVRSTRGIGTEAPVRFSFIDIVNFLFTERQNPSSQTGKILPVCTG
jgi:hypothetical protein